LQTFTGAILSRTEQTEQLTQADQPGALLAVVEVIAQVGSCHCVEANTCSCAACTHLKRAYEKGWLLKLPQPSDLHKTIRGYGDSLKKLASFLPEQVQEHTRDSLGGLKASNLVNSK